MNLHLKYSFLIIIALGFYSCSEDTIDNLTQGNITGKVVAAGTNLPLENVKASTNPTSSIVFTDANGDFEINNVPINSYSVQVDKDGFLTDFEGIEVIANQTTNVIFEMEIETANNRPPNAPILNAPANNAVNIDIDAMLVWSGSDDDDDPLTYSIEILNDQNDDVIEITDITDTTITIFGLNHGYKYFWQVSASDGINEPTLSDVFSFETILFPNNRYLFTRKMNGNNVIFSSDEDGNEIQLTSENTNSWRPRKSNNTNKIAFLRNNGSEIHLHIMDFDGSNVFQITSTVAVAGFNPEELDFAWKNTDDIILYPNFDKLYRISIAGTALQQIHQTANGNFISEIDWSSNVNSIALKTNNNSGYNISIYTINTAGVLQNTVLENVNGAAGGLDFSFDGTKLLYTYDISGNENAQYRQLNSNMFIYDFNSLTITNVSTEKPAGTNDLDPRFSPNEAQIIFTNTSNDGVSQKNITMADIDPIPNRTLFIENAKMGDWK